ncbi:hypothetical protein OMO38_08050 [Chryseobacterium sp. 09-1422]|uniref:Uncharacterized protein n=1 Tax=Chryseobacterium kimseyorum TaxID=2984028 RepID=A0ABT3HXH3_9FLAO|nr:hypothetical protein [Chryseobacterium kimseyorum]MCW3168477.1 hypothetical protein [Chryseobacterium kimseyorum]
MLDFLYEALERLYEVVDYVNGMPECPFEGVEAVFEMPERSDGTVYRFLRWEMG